MEFFCFVSFGPLLFLFGVAIGRVWQEIEARSACECYNPDHHKESK